MNLSGVKNYFWLTKTLDDMSEEEWEALCDGCGLCCLNKIIDDNTDEVYLTNVACDQLNRQTGRCKHYNDRCSYEPDCIKLTKENVSKISWLPKTCAYRLVLNNAPLPDWHPLITGTNNAASPFLTSLRQRIVYEKDVICWQDHIVVYE